MFMSYMKINCLYMLEKLANVFGLDSRETAQVHIRIKTGMNE